MDPVSVVVAALAAGAGTGVSLMASSVITDAYVALKSAVRSAFAGREDEQAAVVVLDEHAKDPDTYEGPLVKKLQQAGADRDPRIVALAQELMAHLDGEGSRQGAYQVRQQAIASGHARVIQVGRDFHIGPRDQG